MSPLTTVGQLTTTTTTTIKLNGLGILSCTFVLYFCFQSDSSDSDSTLPTTSSRNSWKIDKKGLFLSLKVFGLLSSSLLFQQRFGQYVLWPYLGVCQTQEPTQNFELRPLLNVRGVTCSDSIDHNRVQVLRIFIVTHLQSGLNLQPLDDCLLRSLGNQCL